jgi:hypothetical protein
MLENDVLAANALREAQLGNLWPLIVRLESQGPLSDDERKFIVEVLKRYQSERGKKVPFDDEAVTIPWRVRSLKAKGLKQEAAAAQVGAQLGRSRGWVWSRLSKKSK